MPRSPLDQLNPRRICLIKPSALGDVIQALPVLAGLRKRWPDAHISWVVNRSFANLLEGHPDLNEIIEFPRHVKGFRRFSAMWRLARQLRKSRFDLVLDQQGLLRSGLMTWVTRASRRVGFAHAREGATLAYTDKIDTDWKNISAVVKNWEMARALGCEGEPPTPLVPIRDEDRAWARRQIASLPRPLLAIHPGAQWQTKRWPPEHFAELASRAIKEFDAGIILVGGPGEGVICDRIREQIPSALSVAEQTTLKQLAAVLSESDVYLSGDSGPMHLAAAVGVPVIAVFTCTSPTRAGPYWPGHRVVATCVDCAESYIKKCPSMICMQELTPDRVWPALETALHRSPQREQGMIQGGAGF